MGGVDGSVGITRFPCGERERAEGEGLGWLTARAGHEGVVASVGVCHSAPGRTGKSVPQSIRLVTAGAHDGAICQWVFRPSASLAQSRAALIIQARSRGIAGRARALKAIQEAVRQQSSHGVTGLRSRYWSPCTL
jgi:hypothetical protein